MENKTKDKTRWTDPTVLVAIVAAIITAIPIVTPILTQMRPNIPAPATTSPAPAKNTISKPLFSSPRVSLVLASIISVLFIFIIFFTISRLHKYLLRSYNKELERTMLGDIIRTNDGYPSLAIFQLLLWGIVIAFCFLVVFSLRILSGGLELFERSLPITLFGISIANVIVSNAISAYKYGTASRKSPPFETEHNLPPMSTMFEFNDIKLTRLQLFV